MNKTHYMEMYIENSTGGLPSKMYMDITNQAAMSIGFRGIQEISTETGSRCTVLCYTKSENEYDLVRGLIVMNDDAKKYGYRMEGFAVVLKESNNFPEDNIVITAHDGLIKKTTVYNLARELYNLMKKEN